MGQNLLVIYLICLSFQATASPSCLDGEAVTHKEFVPTPFDDQRTTVGEDQVEALKSQVTSYLNSKVDLKISEIFVVSSSSRAPYYTLNNGRKVLDPKSEEKNLQLAREREAFAQKVLKKVIPANVKFESKSLVTGPQFELLDLNTRFVTNLTPGYKDRLEKLYLKNKIFFDEFALTTLNHLSNEKAFPTLYQAKFKPFQGFHLVIKGSKSCRSSDDKKDLSGSMQ